MDKLQEKKSNAKAAYIKARNEWENIRTIEDIKGDFENMKMMALEEAKEYTRQKLAPYYSNERIENVVKHYVSVVRPGVVLVENKNVGLMELYL